VKKIILSRFLLATTIIVLVLSQATILEVKAQEENAWTTLAPMPTPRGGLGAAVVNEKIYAIGGSGQDYNELNVTEEFDPATGIWTTKADMPTARTNLAVVNVQNKIYAISGYYDIPGIATTANEEYDPASNIWISKASMPSARGAVCANVVNDIIYVIGGQDFFGPNDVEISNKTQAYDPLTDTWTNKADMPYGVTGHYTAVFGDKIYVLTSPLQIYDTMSDSWSLGPAPPKVQSNAAAVNVTHPQRRELMYIFGGGQSFSPDLDLVQIYDPISERWGVGASMPTPRKSLAVVVVDGLIYAIGGGKVQGIALSVNERYTPLEVGSPIPTPTPTSTPSPTPTPTIPLTPAPTPTIEPTSTPEPFQLQLAFERVIIVIIIVLGIGLVVYLAKKRRN
jgi:hypothetical protein